MKDFKEITAKCESGQLTVKALDEASCKEAADFYTTFMINSENYKARLGMLANDDFHAMGGKYDALSEEDFKARVRAENTPILAARAGGKIVGLIWAETKGNFFEGIENFNFKDEYAGLAKMWPKMLGKGVLAGGLESVCRAPESFPSASAVLNFAMIDYLAENGIDCAVNLIYKNIWCKSAEGLRNLDTFDYNAYNAYKMLGYEHVGNMPQREVRVESVGITVSVEPQLIAGLDLLTQKAMLLGLFSRENIVLE